MTFEGFLRLALQTVTAPRDVARLLLSLRLPTEALVLGFALVVVGNALVFSISLVLMPPTQAMGLLGNPLALMAIRGVVLLATIASLTWIGQMFGGRARFESIALLLIWLQALSVAVQVLFTFILPIAPQLGSALVFAATAIGAYITVHFLDEAHGLNSIGKSVVVLILGMIAMAVSLSIFLSLVGFTPAGLTGHV
ncbi:YIP1 family protein [Tropicibacter oceani]|uniref:YIP1 family protein n=1 Tax=Tropicibacter oceani TaxID=3058420 RepID=A0ABY8QHB2_9RHOB|nr:YIP1 family protein [Tropicibacter oceani]WGW03192.1 YIP1 family protein [Tropicibacter oceani]